MTRLTRIAPRASRSLAKGRLNWTRGSGSIVQASLTFGVDSRSLGAFAAARYPLGITAIVQRVRELAGRAVATKRTVLRPGPEPYVLRPPLAGRAGRFPAARTRRRTRPRPPRRGRQRERCYCPFALRGRSPPGERFY